MLAARYLTQVDALAGKVAPVARGHRHLQHLLYRFLPGSRAETPQGSLPACASGDVAKTTGATRIRLITKRPSLFPTPIPAPPWVGLAAFLPFARSETGLPRSARVPLDELGSTCSPVARHLRETIRERLHLATSLFGPSLSALLACWFSRRLSVVHFR